MCICTPVTSQFVGISRHGKLLETKLARLRSKVPPTLELRLRIWLCTLPGRDSDTKIEANRPGSKSRSVSEVLVSAHSLSSTVVLGLWSPLRLSWRTVRTERNEADHMVLRLSKKKIVVMATFSRWHLEIVLEYASRLKFFGSGRQIFSKTCPPTSRKSQEPSKNWLVLLLLRTTKPFGTLAAHSPIANCALAGWTSIRLRSCRSE
jgi:hypothetical protein